MSTVSELFDVFSANLGFYRKEYSGRFMCPLCLRTFSRDQIRTNLSKAHIIPQFLDGREWTLACKTCNNKVGSEIESYEAERTKFRRAVSGGGDEMTRAEIWLHDEQGCVVGPVQGDMRAKECGGERRLQLYAKPQGSNLAAWDMFNSMEYGGTPGGQCSAEVRYRVTRSRKRANLTFVHAAYLYMFHQFGYEWVLDPCAEPIRKQIVSPDEPIIEPQAPALSDHQIPDDQLGILLVIRPANWRNFLVVLPLFPDWPKRQAVWMPLFGRPYRQPPPLKDVKLVVADVPKHHGFLSDPDSRMQGFDFILDNFFAYHPVLYTDCIRFWKYGRRDSCDNRPEE